MEEQAKRKRGRPRKQLKPLPESMSEADDAKEAVEENQAMMPEN